MQEFARHAKPETTAGYTRVTEERLLNIMQSIEYRTEPPELPSAAPSRSGEGAASLRAAAESLVTILGPEPGIQNEAWFERREEAVLLLGQLAEGDPERLRSAIGPYPDVGDPAPGLDPLAMALLNAEIGTADANPDSETAAAEACRRGLRPLAGFLMMADDSSAQQRKTIDHGRRGAAAVDELRASAERLGRNVGRDPASRQPELVEQPDLLRGWCRRRDEAAHILADMASGDACRLHAAVDAGADVGELSPSTDLLVLALQMATESGGLGPVAEVIDAAERFGQRGAAARGEAGIPHHPD